MRTRRYVKQCSLATVGITDESNVNGVTLACIFARKLITVINNIEVSHIGQFVGIFYR